MKLLKKGIVFEWDDNKAASNIVKHEGITFEQACEVFFDPFCKLIDATGPSGREIRDAIIGYTANCKILFVVFIEYREDRIRIISAREATSSERKISET